jgi:hypothetical protein
MQETLDSVVKQLGQTLEQYAWEDSYAYANWLAQTYYYVVHSTRLLTAAASRMPFNGLGSQLHYRCAAHVAEEKKHELLAVHDLKALGYELKSFPELSATRLFYEPQYMKIDRVHPIALFGYILVLESLAATHGPSHTARVIDAHGSQAATFLKLHSTEDPGHVAQALENLATLDEEQKRLVCDNIEQSALAYAVLLNAAGIARRSNVVSNQTVSTENVVLT